MPLYSPHNNGPSLELGNKAKSPHVEYCALSWPHSLEAPSACCFLSACEHVMCVPVFLDVCHPLQVQVLKQQLEVKGKRRTPYDHVQSRISTVSRPPSCVHVHVLYMFMYDMHAQCSPLPCRGSVGRVRGQPPLRTSLWEGAHNMFSCSCPICCLMRKLS